MMVYRNNKATEGEDEATKTILVIEDDDSIGRLLVDALSQETPYKAVLVTDGFQALRAVHSIRPSLFITDYRLPFMDGLELYDRLHAQSELEHTPAIIMSAYVPQREVEKRHLVKLNKPFELDDLLNTVERLLV
jgi:CheY-like chemotaxis protein